MLVYADAARIESPRDKLATIAETLGRIRTMPGGIRRHSALVATFIEAGELAQGIADAEFAERLQDAPSSTHEAAAVLMVQFARAIHASWRSGFVRLILPSLDSIRALEVAPLPTEITAKRAEGFAFHALYPESYAMAASAACLRGSTRVVGIRSIGAPLSAMVAAAIGTPLPVTVRPTGHPFRRELAVAGELESHLLAAPAEGFAVVDEGPGLSGSSFGAVADYLEDHGVPADLISFFPSHCGPPGPLACERHRERWGRAVRHFASFEDLVLRTRRPEHRLAVWAADVLGEPEGTLDEISAGQWRRHRYEREMDWPPVHAQQERRKYLLRSRGETWLLKFAGLGREGERKTGRARALHAAGFGPPVVGYRHGFLIERWIDDARPLDRNPVDPDTLADHVGRYLAFRAKAFLAGPERGACPAKLWEMAHHNTEQALGPDLARRFDRWTSAHLAELASLVHPVETDNRLHAWEWLVLPDGRLLKCDAIDHHCGHDLGGCQDVAWDVVGAAVELHLPQAAGAKLCARVERETGRPVDPRLVELFRPCYLAFQLGYYSMAADAARDPAETVRLQCAAARYARGLRQALLAGA